MLVFQRVLFRVNTLMLWPKLGMDYGFLDPACVGNTIGDNSTIIGSLSPVLVCFCVEHPFYTPPFIGPVKFIEVHECWYSNAFCFG